jgi:PH-interacting protein
LQIWNVQTGLLLRVCRGHEGEITDMSVSVDNTLLASASTDKRIRVWSLKVRDCEGRFISAIEANILP